MKISAIRVNGFGMLADLDIDDLPRGLTIVHGPNEAGKSTLLDFVRGVLFGFPDRRRTRQFHPPLRGGRHGGSLQLVDDHGQSWTIERYLDGRHAIVTGPDGKACGEESLPRLLGGADDALFGSVFAFGLAELSSFESLERDEIRDLVFSAGVLGAGRSATHASHQLEQQRLAIVRPRQPDARANQLRRALEDVESALGEARRSAEHYPAAASTARDLGEAVHIARARAVDLRRRASELDRLLTCLPILERRRAAERELAELGSAQEEDGPVLEHAVEIRRLSAARSGHEERTAKRDELLNDLAGIERAGADLLGELGTGIDLSVLRAATVGVLERSRAEALTVRARDEQAALKAREEELESAQSRVRRTAAALAATGRAPREAAELCEQALTLDELRSLVLERDRLDLERAQRSTLDQFALQQANGASRLLLPSALVLGLTSTGLIGFGAVEGLGHRGAIGVVTAALGVIVLAIAGVLCLEARRRAERYDVVSEGLPDGVDPTRLSSEIAKRCALLGLAHAPTSGEIDAANKRLIEERSRRDRLDRLAEDASEASEALTEVMQRKASRLAALAEIDREASAEAARFGLPCTLGPSGLLQALRLVEKLHKLDAAHRRVVAALDELDAVIATFERDLDALRVANGITGTLGPHELVEVLIKRLEDAEERGRRRTARRADLTESEKTLNQSLGSGVEGEHLRSELELGARQAWQEQRQLLAEELVEAESSYEEAFAKERDAARALEELLGSDAVARLELERSALSAELDAVLERWAVLSFAGALLDRTLARYERERQPAVILRASELFCSVSAGHYEKLVAREQNDGKHHGIEAITAAGERVDAGDLSRGTAEQLYLCLRLAFAATFAESAVALPLVLDDVLVNFDPDRARAMTGAIASIAADQQVLAFTCHPHVVEMLQEEAPKAHLVTLPRFAGR